MAILVENIEYNGEILAVLVRNEFSFEGIKFFTPDEFSQQLGYMKHKAGHKIQPHVHNEVAREVRYTKEVLIVKSGKVRVDFYSASQDYLESRILLPGDIVLLAFGGHGFEIIESSEIVEVKQGPYVGEADKTRFEQTSAKKIVVKNNL